MSIKLTVLFHVIFAANLVLAGVTFGQKEVAIAQIQGSGNISPIDKRKVKTTGVVTARLRNGFFLQTPDASKDADPETSEGIYVYTGPRVDPPAEAAVGNLVSVTGDVEEFRRENETLALSITEISFRQGRDSLDVQAKNVELPKTVVLTTAAFAANKIDQLEKYEGMRVEIAEAAVVGPTGGRENEKTGFYFSDGIFAAVIKGIPRPFREMGLDIREIAASPDRDKLKTQFPKLPVFDFNPEIIRVDTSGQNGAMALDVPAQTTVRNLAGVLHYAYGRYTLITDSSRRPNVSTGIKANALPAASEWQITMAGINIENFFDDVDDSGIR
ncbi:MAG: hypothetical protein LC730_00650, partial [Acidobacteria bacterium]|nr:hypothetical protein [Acidobacteriota bacterium]